MTLLNRSANCIKYILFAFNLAFVITGIILISVGVTVTAKYNEYDGLLVPKFFSVPTLLIVTGSFIFFIAFFGCCGAIKENYCMILCFSILLGLIFILELSGGIAGYVLRGDVKDLLSDHLKQTTKEYNTTGHGDITAIWDFTQRKFQCCGVNKYDDWLEVNQSIPLSCCTIPNGASSIDCAPTNENKRLFRKGCLEAFSDYIADHAVSLGATGIILAIIQLIGIFFACYIAREIKIQTGASGLF